ncbi:hypothetical protein DAI22_04g129925 [Oryza sativa Japonica Group]|nr:hypothetical protein DAI22_04g129925 [Oryza sativa Japonica Group]
MGAVTNGNRRQPPRRTLHDYYQVNPLMALLAFYYYSCNSAC